MRVLILGADGYIGTALQVHLREQGHEVECVDNGLRAENVKKVGSQSATEKRDTGYIDLDISKEYIGLRNIIESFKPDTIVHLAEQPSAPFSMMTPETAHLTLSNNVLGTMNVLQAMREVAPEAHLIKLGTEGEYPDWLWDGKHIPEGHYMDVLVPKQNLWKMFLNGVKSFFSVGTISDLETWKIPVPRAFGSWYHSTKFYESHMIEYACRIWGLRATDVNQGVVYGHRNGTRFDYDECFGTVINRFVAQAVAGIPLTIYGKGGQTRGFINLQNSIEAIQLLAENPVGKGEFRVIHQTTQEYSVKEIAEKVQALTGCEIQYIDNPRVEMDENKFTFDHSTLDDLGLQPVTLDEELPRLIEVIKENKDRIITSAIMPQTTWKK